MKVMAELMNLRNLDSSPIVTRRLVLVRAFAAGDRPCKGCNGRRQIATFNYSMCACEFCCIGVLMGRDLETLYVLAISSNVTECELCIWYQSEDPKEKCSM